MIFVAIVDFNLPTTKTGNGETVLVQPTSCSSKGIITMRALVFSEVMCVSGGLDANQCKSDILGGAGLGAGLLGPAGTVLGPAVGAIASGVGALAGGAVAAANSPACQPSQETSSSNLDPEAQFWSEVDPSYFQSYEWYCRITGGCDDGLPW